MPRNVKDTNLATRTDRAKLKPRHKPYPRLLSEGRHLLYRKGKVARGKTPTGHWYVRLYNGDGAYTTQAIAEADDIRDADGETVLTFAQAQARAHDWFREKVTSPTDRNQTVNDALDAYLTWFAREKRAIRSYAHSLGSLRGNIDNHLRPRIGTIPLADLTAHDITELRDEIAAQPARVRSVLGPRFRERPDDPENVRRRRATANKLLNIAKAALNRAYFEEKRFTKALNSDEAWRRVKPFRNADRPTREFLTEDECRRLVSACPEDFRALVQGALFTGCRYGELTAMTVKDFDPDAGIIHVRRTKSGRDRAVYLSDEGARLFTRITMDKGRDDLIFQRSDGEAWGASHQRRRMQDACAAARIGRAVRFHDLRHSYGSLLAKHGVPMLMIADQLGHSDTRITERHYAHVAASVVADTVRAAMAGRGIVEPDNVEPLRPAKTRQA